MFFLLDILHRDDGVKVVNGEGGLLSNSERASGKDKLDGSVGL